MKRRYPRLQSGLNGGCIHQSLDIQSAAWQSYIYHVLFRTPCMAILHHHTVFGTMVRSVSVWPSST